jgi:hypothetical protein
MSEKSPAKKEGEEEKKEGEEEKKEGEEEKKEGEEKPIIWSQVSFDDGYESIQC